MVALVAVATTDVGEAIYVFIVVDDAVVAFVEDVDVTVNVYSVLAVNPVTLYVVPLRLADPPPDNEYDMSFADPPARATKVTVAVVALVAVATTDVGEAIYVFIADAAALVVFNAPVAVTVNVYAVLAVNPVTVYVVPLSV